nr:MAG TPA: hypothetical protein [Caudoviricetes sp.]
MYISFTVVLLVLESNRSIFASVTFPCLLLVLTISFLFPVSSKIYKFSYFGHFSKKFLKFILPPFYHILYLYLLKNTKYCDILVLLANNSKDC